MGLDMTLAGKRYLRTAHAEDQQIADDIQNHFPELGDQRSQYGGSLIQEIRIDVGYWRKANSIHGWFVREVQGGEDDCKTYYVRREQLAELRALCQRVLDFRHLADELLPNVTGFFFGGQGYDEHYYADLEHTIDIIDRALKLPTTWYLEYQSNW